MNYRLVGISVLFIAGSVQNQQSHAQAIRIQQPVVQQFSTGTTVSVPDRGSALLGGFHSGAVQSRQVGPFRQGSSYGQAFQSANSSVSVYIHDFEAMDRMLLNSAPASIRNSGGHQHWKQQLLSQHAHTPDSKRTADSGDLPPERSSLSQAVTQSKAERFFELGRNAEEKHATPNIAILHYRMAVKYGSTKAEARLQKLISHQEISE
ncbi:hypothetical protein [uncultured Gimesia sp.]|uniref:hypothetical protein n=1 Tax=uncultured Gimesia sp. TaxID=1678688 RepID=UPI002638FB33|nr:hypothetical protein [uncultured Gimesia sp.]